MVEEKKLTQEQARQIRGREERLAGLLGTLARRATRWGWLDIYHRIRNGEDVPHWYRGMMELTRKKLTGEIHADYPEGPDHE